MNRITNRVAAPALLLAALATLAVPASARLRETDPEYHDLLELQREYQVGVFENSTPTGKPRAQCDQTIAGVNRWRRWKQLVSPPPARRARRSSPAAHRSSRTPVRHPSNS